MRWLELSQATEVIVKGNAGAKPYVKVIIKEEMPYMQLSKEVEEHQTTDILRIHYDFKRNDKVEIDFEKNKVYIAGKLKNEAIDILYADFFHFDSGTNWIRTVPAMEIEVEYIEKWK